LQRNGHNDLGEGAAGAIRAASTFSQQGSSNDSSRQITSKPAIDQAIATQPDQANPRQQAASNAMPRPTGATKSATSPVPDDRDLAVVLAAWPELPEAIRAGIAAMVKAAAAVKDRG
jgi:hypothetical protein